MISGNIQFTLDVVQHSQQEWTQANLYAGKNEATLDIFKDAQQLWTRANLYDEAAPQQSNTGNRISIVGVLGEETRRSVGENETTLDVVKDSQQGWTQANLYDEAVAQQSNIDNRISIVGGFDDESGRGVGENETPLDVAQDSQQEAGHANLHDEAVPLQASTGSIILNFGGFGDGMRRRLGDITLDIVQDSQQEGAPANPYDGEVAQQADSVVDVKTRKERNKAKSEAIHDLLTAHADQNISIISDFQEICKIYKRSYGAIGADKIPFEVDMELRQKDGDSLEDNITIFGDLGNIMEYIASVEEKDRSVGSWWCFNQAGCKPCGFIHRQGCIHAGSCERCHRIDHRLVNPNKQARKKGLRRKPANQARSLQVFAELPGAELNE